MDTPRLKEMILQLIAFEQEIVNYYVPSESTTDVEIKSDKELTMFYITEHLTETIGLAIRAMAVNEDHYTLILAEFNKFRTGLIKCRTEPSS